VGVDASEEQQARVEAEATALAGTYGDQALIPLSGTYDLLYSMSKGGSSGKVGPFAGAVSQVILDEKRFINQVELGPLTIQLYAERDVIDSNRIRVSFVETVVSAWGRELKRSPTSGKGVWEQVFVEKGEDGSAALRVMRTPSLFVLRQRAQ